VDELVDLIFERGEPEPEHVAHSFLKWLYSLWEVEGSH